MSTSTETHTDVPNKIYITIYGDDSDALCAVLSSITSLLYSYKVKVEFADNSATDRALRIIEDKAQALVNQKVQIRAVIFNEDGYARP